MIVKNKIICINDLLDSECPYPGLTLYKIYDSSIISYYPNDYLIKNDLGYNMLYPIIRFKSLEEFRENQIKKII